jgi:hypothetical protein
MRPGSAILATAWTHPAPLPVVADDLDDLDGTEGDPEPGGGRRGIMPPPWPEHRAAALAGAGRDSIYI